MNSLALQRFYISRGKRVLDVVLSGLALFVLSPVFLLVALAVRTRLGTPIFFRHQRPGLRGKPFTMFKFRTMTIATDDRGKLLADKDRVTRFGTLLRSTSLDELPELFNVLRGDMSIIGPRPLLMQYLKRYSPDQMRRHDVRPGITGWAQVNGRNAITWEQKFRYDLWYVDHLSLSVDLRIVLLTLPRLLMREGITQPGHCTSEEFRGSNHAT